MLMITSSLCNPRRLNKNIPRKEETGPHAKVVKAVVAEVVVDAVVVVVEETTTRNQEPLDWRKTVIVMSTKEDRTCPKVTVTAIVVASLIESPEWSLEENQHRRNKELEVETPGEMTSVLLNKPKLPLIRTKLLDGMMLPPSVPILRLLGVKRKSLKLNLPKVLKVLPKVLKELLKPRSKLSPLKRPGNTS